MKVALIFGGKSSEHEVSCLSAASILDNIKGHEVFPFGITKNGEWIYTKESVDDVRSGRWTELEKTPVTIDLDNKKIVCGGKPLDIDVCFPIVHGRNGEDGRLQGLLEMLGIKYAGSGVLGSAVCMDKITANRLFESAGIRRAKWFPVIKGVNDSIESVKKEAEKLGYPIFVKPSNAGSSVGITKCFNETQLEKALETAFANDTRAVVEKSVEDPLEIEVAVMGNENPIASKTGRIISSNDQIYDYDAKYISGTSQTLVPSGIPEELENEVRKTALKAYLYCGCRGFARVDFLISRDGEININEINTLPGFTSISMFPALFIAGGMTYSELIDKLIEYALN
ncbi:MAG: D-alanine--D-alanine ligase [Clostridia bacterium]|nr:D-alanine--D-alanine ligase [Clostridia bacterium]